MMAISNGKNRISLLHYTALIAMAVLYSNQASAQTAQYDAKALQQIQDTVQLQQEQLNNQAEALDALKKQINELKQSSGDTKHQAGDVGQKTAPSASITPGGEHLKLDISGQVNRAMNVADDGTGAETYFVDHATSGSRVNFEAMAKMSDDLTLASRIEVALAPDNSASVSQSSQAPGDSFNQRWAEVSLKSSSLGKLSLGKGDTASNTTAEADLSGTLSVQNSSVADIMNGMLFRERTAAHNITSIKVSTAFNNLDGLSRESRIRYDTPRFYGFTLAASSVSNRRADAAIFWDDQGYGFKAAARAAISNPNITQAGNRFDGSFSILHLDSGFNFTGSAGSQRRDTDINDTNIYGKLGWLAKLNSFGNTAFTVDYTRSLNTSAANDVGLATGVGVDQFLDKYDTELYLQYRRFALERNSGPAVEDIKAITLGARVRF